MKSYVLTDNIYTLVGMQLSGVEGQLIKPADSFDTVFNEVIKNDEIGILMIAPKLIEANQKKVDNVRFNQAVLLIVEISGADEYKDNQNKITETIQQAVNISV